ncbi:PAS domain-containing sensor histidine kinase [Nitrosococcus wardiae]|uniref:histidine kinase n=1 Tax=Nitrosococcus wardiae TaxID=1814290 RepID=A0A4P7BWK3_9GAMM|nr:PAS domain-containing sensor histidine kinase [Nitrosococcus wardiae]QBQ54453.1 PAS domain-containing sensor histidine kinase [Nitrosococcus wardiae]
MSKDKKSNQKITAPPPSEQLLHHVTEALPVLIAYVDRTLRYRYASPAYEKWFHRPLEAIQDRPVWEVLGQTTFAAAKPYIQRVLSGETVVYAQELPFQRLGPRYVHVQLIPDAVAGQVRGYSVVATDLSEFQALSKRQAHFSALVESSVDAIISYDLEEIVQIWNQGAERLYGYRAEEMVGQSMARLIPAACRAETAQVLAQIRQGQPVTTYETTRLHKNGTAVPVSLTISPIKEAQGQLTGISVVARDITERQHAEAALREQQERLNMALMVSGTTTYRWDVLDNTLQWDESVEPFFNLAPGEGARLSTLKGFIACIHPEDRAAFHRHIEYCVTTGADFSLEYRIIDLKGTVRWLLDRGKMFRDQAGQPLYMTGACIDITLHKQTEAALRESEKKLQEANRHKDEFLATLAHELRNPLTAISTAIELWQSAGDDPAMMAKVMPGAKRQLQQLVRLVDDLLDVSRITRGKIQLHRERLSVEAMIQSALEASNAMIEAGAHTLKVVWPEECLWVEGDLTRLAQVLSNLLINAAKYTPLGGEIKLTAHRAGEEVVLRVQDNGMGMAEEFLPHLFEMFAQATPSQGLGIGLSLVKKLVELHGGRVEVASAGPGLGSTFTVRLPLIDKHEGERDFNGAESW